MTIQISTGAQATHQAAVTEDDTAISLESGDVPVLATPRVIAWMEAAAVSALTGLTAGTTSVGIHIAVDHVAPTLIGSSVHTEATVRKVDGTRIEFDVKAFEGDRLIAGGTHTRLVVDRGRFLTRAGAAVD